MKTTEDRFWEKVSKSEDGCWNWTASQRHKGYGAFCYESNGKIVQGRAHRYSYEIHCGDIPEGMFVLHKCDNPMCVNPDHLFLGTNQDNVNDMMMKGRHVSGGTYCGENGLWKRGEDHHNAKLKKSDVLRIREIRENDHLSYNKIGRMFGINQSFVFKIVMGLAWKSA